VPRHGDHGIRTRISAWHLVAVEGELEPGPEPCEPRSAPERPDVWAVVQQILRDDEHWRPQAHRDRLIRAQDDVWLDFVRDGWEAEKVGGNTYDAGTACADPNNAQLRASRQFCAIRCHDV
jgi:hypothetical protein